MREKGMKVHMKQNLRYTNAQQQLLQYYRKLFQTSPMLTLIWQWNGESFVLAEYNDGVSEIIDANFKVSLGTTVQQYFYNSPELIKDMLQCLHTGETLERKALFAYREIDQSKWVSTQMVAISSDQIAIYFEMIKERRLTEKLQLALYQISETAASSRDLDELYRAVHVIIGELISAENFFIALYDEQAGMIDFAYRVDKYDSAIKRRIIKRGMIEYVVRTGKPVFVTPQIHAELVARGEVITSGTPSQDWLGVPLKMADNRIFGVMAVQTYTAGIRYTEKDRDILTFVSNQVAMAIERKQAEERLRFLSLHDALTGLHNRGYFEETLSRLKENHHIPIAIVVCDIDGLKLVNDTMGHRAGDELLITAARIIRMVVREGDVTVRMGGDEFAVILHGMDEVGADALCERIRIEIAQYNKKSDGMPLSMSLGCAIAYDETIQLQDLLQQADNYMYREKLQQSRSAHSDIVQTVIKMLEARDFITEGHTDRVEILVSKMAAQLGFPKQIINELSLLSRFHDIGKVGISDNILFKPGPLTSEERKEIERHCEIGYRIARCSSDLLPIADLIFKHHEWWNGNGYPLGLSGEQIPMECRILAIVDAYDAMTSDRPYRKSMRHDMAIAELQRNAGTQFDPKLVESFINTIK